MKKRYIVLFCLLFLMIPTYIAISYIIKGSSTPIVIQNLKTVTLVSPNQAEYVLEYSEDNEESVILNDLFSKKKSVKSLPSDLDTTRHYEITYESELYSTTVKGYFTEDPENCYLEYKNGVKTTYYRVNKDTAEAFLDSRYSEGVYVHASIPELMIGGKEVYALSADWNYITYSGNERKASELAPVGSGISNVGSVSSSFACLFDTQPDDVQVAIKRSDTGETIYSGGVDGIDTINIKENFDVSITIDAVWNKSEEKKYYGTVRYTATAKLHQPPYFFLSEPQIKCGELVVLSCKNVIDINDIQFTSYPEINYTPVFFEDGEYHRALIPISMELGNEQCTYKFTVCSGETAAELELLVLKRSDSQKTVYNISKAKLDSLGVKPDGDEIFNPYSSLYQSIKGTIAGNTDFSTEYFVGRFDYGYAKGILRAGFGDNIRFSAWSQGQTCRSFDYFYVGNSKKDPISAVNGGKVVYIGEQIYTGRLVVIDHGYGLLSWYSNIGSLEDGIAVGEVVEKGAVIGYNGGEGLTESFNGTNVSVHIALTVFGVPVDISSLTTEGIIILDN